MMDDLCLAAVAARVVAWHNSHPLARRISVAHVHAVGYVGLPFVGAAGAAVPDLATLQADFSEDFIDPLNPRAVARFATRTGRVLARPPADAPVREVRADGGHPGWLPARVYLLTAVVETATRKSRVLVGTGLTAPVLGWRIFDAPRVAALAGLVGLLVGVPAWLLRPADAPQPSAQAVPLAVASPASAVGVAAVADTVALVPSPALAASDGMAPVAVAGLPVDAAKDHDDRPSVDTARAARGAASAAAPAAPVRPAARIAVAPSIRPVISDEDKARARQAREALGSPRQAAASAPGPALAPSPAPVSAPAPAPAPAPLQAQAQPMTVSTAPAFALSTRTLRTRAEAEQVQVAMRSLLRTVGATDLKVDVLPQGDDWRVVALPFPQRLAADKARSLLLSRGMRVEVIAF